MYHHPNAPFRATDSTLQQVFNVEFRSEVVRGSLTLVEYERGLPRDDEKLVVAGEVRNDVIRDAIGKERLGRVARQVLKGKNYDGWLAFAHVRNRHRLGIARFGLGAHKIMVSEIRVRDKKEPAPGHRSYDLLALSIVSKRLPRRFYPR